ncbi:branched-chain amino acid ABC transporter permease [Arthrobacter sp. ISL-28]|uniref:branched-chain amino acid ABC transporter permease n=1 Tax=Arthrobacter sp. ISL-28 TaxID=2819108 RepID=UPI001BE676F8|nr:branched-chain amino acid ABC transporter permease [Arthrobacter sp. ISL-28]MBT2523314.1 branched-chain amino acid ABC transporter permease [Arthrobacter sp. ISL-28]
MIEVLASGILLGGLYALVALGFVLTFLATRTANFATGELMALGAVVALGMVGWDGIPAWLRVTCAVIVMGIAGAIIYRLVIVPFAQTHDDYRWLIATLGLGMIVVDIILNSQGQAIKKLDYAYSEGFISLGGAGLARQGLIICALAIVLTLGIAAVMRWTPAGTIVRAVAEDDETAQLMGISTRLVGYVMYALATAIVALGGILWGAQVGVTPSFGVPLMMGAIGVAIIGGLDSITGVLVGGLIYGVVSQLGQQLAGPALGSVAGLLIVLVVLVVRPQGLFGRAIKEKV